MSRTCSIEGCERQCHAKGWCLLHYKRWWKHGDPSKVIKVNVRGTPEQRFWAKVTKTEGCWLWIGSTMKSGYGSFLAGDGTRLAHRFAYELLVGPIPAGLTLDHLCRNPSCVNPAHLEPVTMRENTLRGTGRSAQYAAKSHCCHGHPFDEANTRWYGPENRWRACRACHRERTRQIRARRLYLQDLPARIRDRTAVGERPLERHDEPEEGP